MGLMSTSIEELGIETHADVKYESGPVDCNGLMIICEESGNLIELMCLLCGETVCVPAPPDMTWQDRKDLA